MQNIMRYNRYPYGLKRVIYAKKNRSTINWYYETFKNINAFLRDYITSVSILCYE